MQRLTADKIFKDGRILIMGILNVTPDSFSDAGKFLNPKKAVARALQMVEEGADIIDIGGESSGPGSVDVKLEQELKRVIPVVKELNKRRKKSKKKFLISVDTYKSEVAEQAVEAGADMINDVTAFRGDSEMARTLAVLKVPVVIMFSKDSSARTTRNIVHYSDVVKTIAGFLKKRMMAGIKAGIRPENFIVDPGMGAFVSMDSKYSLQILKNLKKLAGLGRPILIGASRKGFISQILSEPGKSMGTAERLEGSLACAIIAAMNGASILRVHDVKETRRVMEMVGAIIKS